MWNRYRWLVSISLAPSLSGVGLLLPNPTAAYICLGIGGFIFLAAQAIPVYVLIQRRRQRKGRAATNRAKEAATVARTRERAKVISVGIKSAADKIHLFCGGFAKDVSDSQVAVHYQDDYRSFVEGNYQAAKNIGFVDAELDRLCASPATTRDLRRLGDKLEILAKRMREESLTACQD